MSEGVELAWREKLMVVCSLSAFPIWILLLLAGVYNAPRHWGSWVSREEAHMDEGWDLLATSSPREIARHCVPTWNIPPGLRGSYYVSGPALFEIGKYAFETLFDGFGKINRFELGRGEMCYTTSFLNTSYRRANEELVAGGHRPRGTLFDDTLPSRGPCPAYHPMCDVMATNDNNWVNTIPIADHAVLVSDTPLMLRLDTTSARVAGCEHWANETRHAVLAFLTVPHWMHGLHVPSLASAHPLRRPGSSEYVEFLTEYPVVPGQKHYLSFYTFDGQAEEPARALLFRFEVDQQYYMHSFGVTKNYIICPLNLVLDLPMPPKPAVLLGAFRGAWRGVYVIDKRGTGQLFQTEPFFHSHIANSFENATGVVVDLGTYADNAFAKSPQIHIRLFKNKTLRDAHKSSLGRMAVTRLHFHTSGPLKGTTTREALLHNGRNIDFFNINPAYHGRPYCIYYATEWFHDDASYASMAILKHDICRGTVRYWSRPSTYLGEPFFVGGSPSGREDDGVVMVVALSGQRRTSFLLVLDARELVELERMYLPVHVPFTGHGQFIPSRSARTALRTPVAV